MKDNFVFLKPSLFFVSCIGFLAAQAILFFSPVFFSNTFFLVGFPVVAMIFLFLFFSPEKFLLIIIFLRIALEPFLEISRIGGEGMGLGAIINLAVIVLGISFFLRQRKEYKKIEIKKVWFFFLFFSFVAIFYAPFFSSAIRLFLNFVTYMVMALAPFFIVKTKKDVNKWLKILMFSSVIPFVYAYIDFLNLGIHGLRIKGFFHHPNQLAYYLIFVIILGMYILNSENFKLKKFSKFLIIFYICNLLILLLATKTRNAWISLWSFFFIYGILKEKKALVFSLFLIFIVLILPATRARIEDLFIYRESLNSLAWRFSVWKSSFSEIVKNIYFGHGLGSFIPASEEFFKNSKRGGVGAHSAYIQLLFEMGIAGFFAFFALFIKYLKIFFSAANLRLFRFSKKYLIISIYILTYLIICGADNLLYYLTLNWYIFFFLGVVMQDLAFDLIAQREYAEKRVLSK